MDFDRGPGARDARGLGRFRPVCRRSAVGVGVRRGCADRTGAGRDRGEPPDQFPNQSPGDFRG